MSGCDAPVQAGADLVAGNYTADTFEYIKDDGTVVSLLANGSAADVRIDRNGEFTADLLVPVALSGAADSEIHITGRWSFAEGVLSFEGDPVTFLDGMLFSVRDGKVMYGQTVVRDNTVRIRLVDADS